MDVIACKKKPMLFEDALGTKIALQSFGADGSNMRDLSPPTEDSAHGFRSVTAPLKRRNHRIADLTTPAIIRSTLEPGGSYE